MAVAQNAIVAQKTKLYRGTEQSDGTLMWEKVNSVSGFSGPNTTKAKIDTTDFDSQRKAYLFGLPDEGDISFTMFFNPADATHRAIMQEDVPADYNRQWRMVLSDGTTYLFTGNVSGAPLAGNADGVVTWNLTITISGNADWLWKDLGATITWDSSLAGTDATGAVTGSIKADLAPSSGTTGTAPKFATGTFKEYQHYILKNVPDGLVGVVTRVTDTQVSLAFTGTSTTKKDTTEVSLSFLDLAFANNLKAVEVSGSAKNNISITFA